MFYEKTILGESLKRYLKILLATYNLHITIIITRFNSHD
jgi:hypothetical protein